MESLKYFFRDPSFAPLFILIFAVFLLIRIQGVDIPYHQDEYKWPLYSYNIGYSPGSVPHPPLTEFIYVNGGQLVGADYFRLIPLGFSILNFFLLGWLAYVLFKNKFVVLSVLFLFTISFYSVLASLMVDVDGAVMPFFLLLLSIGYFKFKDSNFSEHKWLSLIAIGAFGGFLIKMSALLPIFAFAFDFAIEKRALSDRKKILKYFLWFSVSLGVLLFLLISSKYIFPTFNLEYSINYWKHFANSSGFASRGWFQTLIQFIKAVLYTSPLLLAPLIFIDRAIISRLRPLILFVFGALLFYIVLFDFSIGALDRYFQLFVVPFSLVSGVIFQKHFFGGNDPFSKNKLFIVAILLTSFIFLIQFINQAVPPLYPKTEWINRAISLKWNFLYPFSGGSGPIPFYVSFAFLALSWISVSILALWGKIRNISRREILFLVLILGLSYNLVFIEEYLFGKINGSSSYIIKNIEKYIESDSKIKFVTVYNDNGGWDIQSIGKYRKRLYIDPKFDIVEKVATLNKYKEHYMVVDIPHIDENTPYAKYFSGCNIVYEDKRGVINGFVYDCEKRPDLKI